MFGPCAVKRRVLKDELDDFAMARSDSIRSRFEITPRQRPQPTPAPPKCLATSRDQVVKLGFAGEKGSGQNTRQRLFGHAEDRRNAPTCLTLREENCATRSVPQAMKSTLVTFPWGNPREAELSLRAHRAPSLEHSTAEVAYQEGAGQMSYSSSDASEPVVVLETNDGLAVGLAKGSLEEADIPFFVFDGVRKHGPNFVGPYSLNTWIQVLVPRDREAEARELLMPLLNPEPDGQQGVES